MTLAHRHGDHFVRRRGRLAAVLIAGSVVLVASPWAGPASCSAEASAERAASAPPAISAGAEEPPPAVRGPAAGVAAPAPTPDAAPGAPPDPATLQRGLDASAAAAAALDVEQGAAVIDRMTGQLVAGVNGDTTMNSESLTKLFTAAYYLVETGGAPGAALASDLRALIVESDNGIQMDLWRPDIVSTMAARYQLPNSAGSAAASSETWGSDQVTANDLARFLFAASRDPAVGPLLMAWMAGTAPIGGDGFDQSFGFNALTGDHGSKQGWSDPGWSPANLHSVGWTDRYVGAVLQTSPTATYAAMRATSTATVTLIAGAG